MTERQRQEITDRFARKLAAIVAANHHRPRGADIKAMLERAKLREREAT